MLVILMCWYIFLEFAARYGVDYYNIKNNIIMAGGIIQLVATGVQNIYLSDDPQITFFKIIYRRHTNFAIESVPQYFENKIDFGSKSSVTISSLGDLMGQIILCVEIPEIIFSSDSNTKFAWVQNLGYAIIDNIGISIDDKIIDRQYGEFMYIWNELSRKQSTDKLIGNIQSLTLFTKSKPQTKLYIPLQFWFCRCIGLALPLVALSKSLVNITFTANSLQKCCAISPTDSIQIRENVVPFEFGDDLAQNVENKIIRAKFDSFDYLTNRLYYNRINTGSSFESATGGGFNPKPVTPLSESTRYFTLHSDRVETRPIYNLNNHAIYCNPVDFASGQVEDVDLSSINLVNCYLYVDYIYLDTTERQNFISTNHEYLITQTQFPANSLIESTNLYQKMSLNNLCKEIFFVIESEKYANTTNVFDYVGANNNSLLQKASLILNGKMGQEHNWQFYNYYQPYIHHNRIPPKGIYSLSFALYPELFQPSSTLNMSKIDNQILNLHLSSEINTQSRARLKIYATNYNILRIYLGMAGLVF